MPISDARLAANRKNALRSTGPRTQEGKDRSRMNCLKHGLTSEVIRVPEDAESVADRSRSWLGAFKPQNLYHAWIMDEMAVLTVRLDRSGRIERRLRDKVSLRAELFWDDDRRSEAEAIGARLSGNPAATLDLLRRTPQGCEWLMTRWALLARAADRDLRWDPAQKALAFDLLGVPIEARGGTPGELIDLEGRVVDPGTGPADVARREVAALLARRDEVAPADDLDRSMAEADMADEPTDELRRLRRYETALHRRLRWYVAQIGQESPRLRTNSDLLLNFFRPVDEPAPEPAPPEQIPPPEAEPEAEVEAEPEVEAGPTAAPAEVDEPTRRQERARKAESRREARLRKLDRRRA